MNFKTKIITITTVILSILTILVSCNTNTNTQPLKLNETAKDFQINMFTSDKQDDKLILETKLYKLMKNSQTFSVKTAVLLEVENYTCMGEHEGISESIQEEGVEKVEENDVIDDIQEIKDDGSEDWVTFEATAYTAFCSTGCTGITRTGYDVSETIYYEGMRVIAVDPNVIPLHSIVEVATGEKVFTAIALDTGGNIKSYRIDILKETKEGALKFGRRDVEIKIKKIGGTK